VCHLGNQILHEFETTVLLVTYFISAVMGCELLILPVRIPDGRDYPGNIYPYGKDCTGLYSGARVLTYRHREAVHQAHLARRNVVTNRSRSGNREGAAGSGYIALLYL
jgi:hypothetical protein